MQELPQLVGKKLKFFKTLLKYNGDALEAYMKTYRVQQSTAEQEVYQFMQDNNIMAYLIEYATQMSQAGISSKKNVSPEEVTQTARRVRDICLSTFSFNPSAALQANEQLGKIGGLFIDVQRNEPEQNRKLAIDNKLKELAEDSDYQEDDTQDIDERVLLSDNQQEDEPEIEPEIEPEPEIDVDSKLKPPPRIARDKPKDMNELDIEDLIDL